MLAVHAFDEGLQAAVPASGPVSPARPVSPGVAHATSFATPPGAPQAGSALMRRSLEDSASLLLLAGVGAPNATAAIGASSRPLDDREVEHTPAINSAHGRPVSGRALASDDCGTGCRRDCDSMPSGTDSAEDADAFSPSPVSSAAAAQGPAQLYADVNGMPAGSLGPNPAQPQLHPDGGAHCKVRLLLSLCAVMLDQVSSPQAEPAAAPRCNGHCV